MRAKISPCLISFITLLFVSNYSLAQVEFQTRAPLTSMDIQGLEFNDILTADLNMDGFNDIITIGSGGTYLFMNLDGDSFEKVNLDDSPPSWYNPTKAQLYDVDGDGDLDIVTCNYTAWYINIYTNDGAGNFTVTRLLTNNNSTGAEDIIDFYIDDFDLDGDFDFVIVKDVNAKFISWLENDGNLGFTSHEIADNADYLAYPFDYENDGDKDVIVFYYSGAKILKNNGSLNFVEVELGIASFGLGSIVTPDDIDNDGDMDFIIGKSYYNGTSPFTILENQNNNTFIDHLPNTNNNYTYIDINTIEAIDMDGDNDKDLVCGTNSSDGLGWFENNGNFNFGDFHIPSPIFNEVNQLNLGDLNNDGVKDWIYFSESEDQFLWFDTQSSDLHVFDDYSFVPTQVLDVDNDGQDDLVGLYRNVISWAKNVDGFHFDINLLTRDIYRDYNFYTIFSKDFTLGDINNDGFVDVVGRGSANDETDQIMWLEGQGGTSFVKHLIPNNIPFDYNYHINDLFDIDKDGDLDIFLVRDDRLYWLENDGQGNFQVDYIDLDGSEPEINGWDYGDVNSDGYIDIVIRNVNGIYLYENDGSENFSQVYLYTFQDDSGFFEKDNIKIMDVDNDGLEDIVSIDDDVGFFWLNQIENYQFIYRFLADLNKPFYAHDLDLDGDTDFIQYNDIFENTGHGIMSSYPIQDNVPYVSSTITKTVIDVDGDGDLDYVVKSNDETLIIKENLAIRTELEGFAYWDENGNQIYDPNEYLLPDVNIISEPGGVNGFTDAEGNYQLYLGQGNYQISSQAPLGWELNSSPVTYDVVMDSMGVSGISFGFSPSDTIQEVRPYIASNIVRCNSESMFNFNAKNLGTVISSGVLWVSLDDIAVDSIEFDEYPDHFTDSLNFGWTYTNLYPGEIFEKKVLIYIPGISDDVSVGDTLHYESFTTTNGTTDSLFYNYEPILLCSYDPNDKLVSPANRAEPNYLFPSEDLTYTIRFQNTGNDTAFLVVVQDYLDEYLDVSTFRVVSSSHLENLNTNIMTASNHPLITFSFEDIMLPDSTTNPLGSQGYVMFTMSLKDNIPEGYELRNHAEIYFDANPPIITNSTLNTYVTEIPCSESDEELFACDSLLLNGVWYYESTFQSYDVFVAPYVCNRINTQITIHPSSNVYEEIFLLSGESHTLPDGTVVDEAGEYISETMDENGCIIYTYTSVETPVGISEILKEFGLHLFPNPLSNELNIHMEFSQDYQIQIFDALGKSILSQTIHQEYHKIRTNDWDRGLYWIQFTDSNGKRITTKLIKI